MYEGRDRQRTNSQRKERSCATLAAMPHRTIPATPPYSGNGGTTPTASFQHLEKLQVFMPWDSNIFKLPPPF